MAEVEKQAAEPAADLFTPDERAYFDSRGEKPIPQEPPQSQEPQIPQEAQQPQQPQQPQEAPPPEERSRVDYGAFHAEREKRRVADEKVRELELLNARMEERFKAWQDATRPPVRRQQPRPPPSPDTDIFGAVKHLANQQARTSAEINNYKRQLAAQDQVAQLQRFGNEGEVEFKKATPDYDQALAHLRQARKAELAAWGMNEAQANFQLNNEELQLIARAAQLRRNPAEMAYTLAKQRGFAATPGTATNAPTTIAQQLDVIEQGQQAARSMSNVGGRANTGGEMTLADLVRLPDAEFFAFKNKNPAKYRRLKGADH